MTNVNNSNTRAGGTGGIHDRGDHSRAGGNGDSADQQVDTPAGGNRSGGSLGRVNVRDDRTKLYQKGGNEGVPRRGTHVSIVDSRTTGLVSCATSA